MDARQRPPGVEEVTGDPGSEDPGLHMAVCHVEGLQTRRARVSPGGVSPGGVSRGGRVFRPGARSCSGDSPAAGLTSKGCTVHWQTPGRCTTTPGFVRGCWRRNHEGTKETSRAVVCGNGRSSSAPRWGRGSQDRPYARDPAVRLEGRQDRRGETLTMSESRDAQSRCSAPWTPGRGLPVWKK